MNYNTINIPGHTIIRKIGEGGMGVVFLAVDNMLQRQVAVKILKSELAPGEETILRFQSEAVMLAKLRHPNITMLYNMLQTNGYQCMIMEFVEGETLESMLKNRGIFPVKQVLDIAIHALEGLQHAHSRGVIHRDLKPSNLMLSTEGEIKIMDFGIARIAGGSRFTRVGQAVGTPQYMSPEQIRGQEGDHSSDIYSIGIVLYELLTDTTPFDADSEFEIMQAHTGRKPVPPISRNPDIPELLNSAILKALEKDPSKRFINAEDFRQCLLQINKQIAGETPSQTMLPFHWKMPEIITQWKAPKIPINPKLPFKIDKQYLIGAGFLMISLIIACFVIFRNPENKEKKSLSEELISENKNPKIEVETEIDMNTIMQRQYQTAPETLPPDISFLNASIGKKEEETKKKAPDSVKQKNPSSTTKKVEVKDKKKEEKDKKKEEKDTEVRKPPPPLPPRPNRNAPRVERVETPPVSKNKQEETKLGRPVMIPRGTRVEAVLDNSYSYDSSNNDYNVTLTVTRSVERSGVTIISAGAKVYARIRKRPRILELEILEVESVTKRHLKSLRNIHRAYSFQKGQSFRIDLEYNRMN